MNNAWTFHFLWIDVSLNRCDNSSCMRYEMDFYIHLSHDCVYGLFYLLPWMRRSSSLWHCCIPSIILESAVSWGFYWPCVVFRWLLLLGPGPKTFQRRHPSYLPGMVESTAHHCFSRRCNSHVIMVLGGEGFWWWLTRVLFT